MWMITNTNPCLLFTFLLYGHCVGIHALGDGWERERMLDYFCSFSLFHQEHSIVCLSLFSFYCSRTVDHHSVPLTQSQHNDSLYSAPLSSMHAPLFSFHFLDQRIPLRFMTVPSLSRTSNPTKRPSNKRSIWRQSCLFSSNPSPLICFNGKCIVIHLPFLFSSPSSSSCWLLFLSSFPTTLSTIFTILRCQNSMMFWISFWTPGFTTSISVLSSPNGSLSTTTVSSFPSISSIISCIICFLWRSSAIKYVLCILSHALGHDLSVLLVGNLQPHDKDVQATGRQSDLVSNLFVLPDRLHQRILLGVLPQQSPRVLRRPHSPSNPSLRPFIVTHIHFLYEEVLLGEQRLPLHLQRRDPSLSLYLFMPV